MNSIDASPRHFLTPQEAIDYLGVTSQEFDSLRKQYGIGRYNFPRSEDQFMYALEDLDRLKAAVTQRKLAA